MPKPSGDVVKLTVAAAYAQAFVQAVKLTNENRKETADRLRPASLLKPR